MELVTRSRSPRSTIGNVLINTTAGALKAEVEGLVRARGVRYATAYRFAEPEPYSWDGVLDATQRGPACPQPPSSLAAVVGNSVDGLTFDEHCQVLTVTAPVDASGLPVMVWFHGGAYVTGSGESAKYDAEPLAHEGVVVVSVSYRLGVFGYLHGQPGPARPARRAAVGAGQHRRVRRRSGQRDGVRSVRGRGLRVRVDAHRHREPVPPRDPAERAAWRPQPETARR